MDRVGTGEQAIEWALQNIHYGDQSWSTFFEEWHACQSMAAWPDYVAWVFAL